MRKVIHALTALLVGCGMTLAICCGEGNLTAVVAGLSLICTALILTWTDPS